MDCRYSVLLVSCLVAAGSGQLFQQEPYDYCDPRLKLCELFTDHTMCKYPVPGPSPQCTKGLQEPLNSTEKDRILFWHNKFRSYIANGTEKSRTRRLPPASNMRQMYWDGELETIAARWANQCTSMTNAVVYDKCRNTKRFRVSQNVGTRRVNGTSIEKQAPQIVITWYKEIKDFDPALVDRFAPPDENRVSLKQFSTLIWADTYAVGCARVIFQERLPTADKESKSTIWTLERLVCNYGPAGNEPGKPIYKRGAPCENCPGDTDCSRNFPGLCAIQISNRTGGKDSKTDGKEKPKLTAVGKEGAETETPPSSKADTEEEEEEEEDEEEEDDEEDYNNCKNGQCYKNLKPGDSFSDITFPKPTARKKFREVGLVVPGHGKDINIEKWKWLISNSKKVRRNRPEEKRTFKNGDTCNCFVPAVGGDDNGSPRSDANPFPLLFSAFITVETFLFSAYHCN